MREGHNLAIFYNSKLVISGEKHALGAGHCSRYYLIKMLTSTEHAQFEESFDVLLGALDRFMALEAGWCLKDPDEFMRLSLSEDKNNWLEYYERDLGELLKILFEEIRKIKEFEDLELSPGKDNFEQNVSAVFEFIDSKRQVDNERISTDMFERRLFWATVPIIMRNALFCLFKFGKQSSELISDARSGAHEAFFKLVRLDSTFLFADFAHDMIRRAEVSDDYEFKRKLSASLKPNPKFWDLHDKRNFLSLHVLSYIGFENKPYSEWADFLASKGFDNYADSKALAKAAERYGIPKKHSQKNP